MPVRRKIKLFFVIFPIIGTVLFPFSAWAMDPLESRFSLFPKDLLQHMYTSHLYPMQWTKAREVSRHWNGVLSDLELWKGIGGGECLSTPDSIKGQQALAILNKLFQQNPRVAKEFGILNRPIPSLEVLRWPFSHQNPTAAAFINFYLFKYMKVLSEREDGLEYKMTSEQIISEFKDKAAQCLESAYKEGHPEAAWQKCTKSRKKFILTTTSEKKLCLQAALGGSSKAKKELLRTMFGSFVTPTLPEESDLSDGSDLNCLFNELVNLAQIWPEARECMFRYAMFYQVKSYPDKEGYILSKEGYILSDRCALQLENVGNGKPTELSFLLIGDFPINVKWPEAFLLLGTYHTHPYRKKSSTKRVEQAQNHHALAQNYFIKAYEKGAENSALTLAKFLPPIPENKELLVKIITSNPMLGTAWSKYCQILLNCIPENAAEDDPQACKFFTSFQEAYKFLGRNVSYLPVEFIQERLRSPDAEVNVDMTVTTPVELIDLLAHCLDKKGEAFFKIRVAFLDWIMRTPPHYPCNCAYGTQHWTLGTMLDYLSGKWGRHLTVHGIVEKEEDKEKWNSRDTLFATEFFLYTLPEVQQNFNKILMDIALVKKEKETFENAFKSYCLTLTAPGADEEEETQFTKAHYDILSHRLTKFLEKFPAHTHLPFLFASILNEKDWKKEAVEHYKIAAKNGSKEAQEFLETLVPQQSKGTKRKAPSKNGPRKSRKKDHDLD